jgi:DNA-binding GntR family transcriptional regulator
VLRCNRGSGARASPAKPSDLPNSEGQPLHEPVQRQSLAEKVYQHLKSQLEGHQLSVGDRVNARQIATDLGVSRTTVNKAIERLVIDRLVVVDDARHPVVSALPAKLKVFDSPQFEFSNQTESTYELLLERILRGDFRPGEIIKERRLALEIGVNPATIRRAAEWLRRDGLLDRLPRRGWQVTLLSPRDLKDAYEIRILLEPLAVGGAVSRITNQDLDLLSEQTERMIVLAEQATVYDRREADHQFHKVICVASGNRTLVETLVPLVRQVLLITTVGFRYGRSMRSFEEHREILRAMKARNEREAVRLVKAHLRKAMKFNAEMWERH